MAGELVFVSLHPPPPRLSTTPSLSSATAFLKHIANRPLSKITGATGFIGFAVLLETLQAGYRVRASVRLASQITTLRAHPLLQPFLHHLDLVVVPDITLVGAFDDVLKDVIYVEHVASPLPNPVRFAPSFFLLGT